MLNEIIFLIHIFVVAGFSITGLLLGSYALVASIALQGILSNLFVTKQITLFGQSVTCSDAFAVGSILSLNLLQEYHGKYIAKKAVFVSFFCLVAYLTFSQIHMLYIPNQFDTMQKHFSEILQLMPRITIASISAYLLTQIFDIQLFGYLKQLFNNKKTTVRSLISLVVSQFIDTSLFSLLALYGVVNSISNVIFTSLTIKIITITLLVPFIKIVKKFKHT